MPDLAGAARCPVIAGVAIQVQLLPGEPGTLVRATARFPPTSPRSAAEAMIARLTTPGQLWRILPRTAWDARLVYVTFPILASATGGPVATARGRAPSLQFTLRMYGTAQAMFNNPRWLAAWKAALKARLPGGWRGRGPVCGGDRVSSPTLSACSSPQA